MYIYIYIYVGVVQNCFSRTRPNRRPTAVQPRPPKYQSRDKFYPFYLFMLHVLQLKQNGGGQGRKEKGERPGVEVT